jgi:hypothetical protein
MSEREVLNQILEDLKSDLSWAEKKTNESREKKDEKMRMFYHGIKVHSNTMIDRVNSIISILDSYEES